MALHAVSEVCCGLRNSNIAHDTARHCTLQVSEDFETCALRFGRGSARGMSPEDFLVHAAVSRGGACTQPHAHPRTSTHAHANAPRHEHAHAPRPEHAHARAATHLASVHP
jgi:hypothetical protein